jgi:hypothetical protein
LRRHQTRRRTRLTGLSVWGASWEYTESERDRVRKLIDFLEDRRVLFDDFAIEVPEAVFASIVGIREELTKTLQALGEDAAASSVLRRMRGACSLFLSGPGREAGFGYGFWIGLGQLRGYLGSELSNLSGYYEIEIDGPLHKVLTPTIEQDASLEGINPRFQLPRVLQVPPPSDLPFDTSERD